MFDVVFLTGEERAELASRLALIYLEKSDVSGLSPEDFTKEYFKVKAAVRGAIDRVARS